MSLPRVPTPTPWHAALACALLGTIVALQRPLFHDEASTYYFAGQGLAHYLHLATTRDLHPIGAYAVSGPWLALAGPHLIGLRVLNAFIMGAAVLLFLRAIQRFRPTEPLPAALIVLCGLSPFLVHAGSFARYYSLACLAFAAFLLAAAHLWNEPSPRRAAVAGALCGLVWNVNYATGLSTAAAALVLLACLHRRRVAAVLVPFAASAAVLFAASLPILLAQLQYPTGDRLSSGGGALLLQAARATTYSLYAYSAGDGLPPWGIVGVPVAGVLLVLAVVGARRAFAATDAAPGLAAGALVMLGSGIALGTVMFPGSMFIYLPHRTPIGFLALAFLVAGVAPAAPRTAQRLAIAATIACALGLGGTIIARATTNWAYDLPLDQIADRTGEAIAESGAATDGSGPIAFHLPPASFQNVRFVLERRFPNLAINPASPLPAGTSHLILGAYAPDRTDRPPATAPTPEVTARRWRVDLVEEPALTRAIKRAITRRDVASAKLYLELRTSPPAPASP